MQSNKQIIRLNEDQLNQMIEEAIYETLQEGPVWDGIKGVGKTIWGNVKNAYGNAKLQSQRKQAWNMVYRWMHDGIIDPQQTPELYKTADALCKQFQQLLNGAQNNNQQENQSGTQPDQQTAQGNTQPNNQGTTEQPVANYNMTQPQQTSQNVSYGGNYSNSTTATQQHPTSQKVAKEVANNINKQGETKNHPDEAYLTDYGIQNSGKTPRPVITESKLNKIVKEAVYNFLAENQEEEDFIPQLTQGVKSFFGTGYNEGGHYRNTPDDRAEQNGEWSATWMNGTTPIQLGRRWNAAKTGWKEQGKIDKNNKELKQLSKRQGDEVLDNGMTVKQRITDLKRRNGGSKGRISGANNDIYRDMATGVMGTGKFNPTYKNRNMSSMFRK